MPDLEQAQACVTASRNSLNRLSGRFGELTAEGGAHFTGQQCAELAAYLDRVTAMLNRGLAHIAGTDPAPPAEPETCAGRRRLTLINGGKR